MVFIIHPVYISCVSRMPVMTRSTTGSLANEGLPRTMKVEVLSSSRKTAPYPERAGVQQTFGLPSVRYRDLTVILPGLS